jgi:hypothetical protein
MEGAPMPRRTSQRSRYSLPVRYLAIFLASSLLPMPALATPPPGPSLASRNGRLSTHALSVVRPAPTSSGAAVAAQTATPTPNRFTCSQFDPNAYPILTHRNAEADKWGDITVAQPKIWQFERVSALLDGLLRDVEGISLGDLTQLDPSQQNAAALKFVQSALEVGVQYDQAGAVNAANTLNNYKEVNASQTQQLNQYNTYMMTLTSERDRLAAQYSAASNEVNALQAMKAAGTLTPAQQAQLDEATSRQASTNASLASVNSLITGAGPAPTLTAPPTVTGTSVQKPASGSDMSSSLMGFSEMLKSLPAGIQKNLDAALSAPSYPATKKLDNFITLLYERLAREISVLQDDLTRDPENVAFLLQFDVGLYPSKKSKNHVARVEFNLDCPGCKVYSLYPGQSSYNVANYSGSSKRTTLWGNVLTLIGFGLSASYRRQEDMLSGSLVQSVYTAGFQNGTLYDRDPRSHDAVDGNRAEQSFGWYYGAAPFEELVTPGIHTTFAMITVPRDLIYKTEDRFGNADACMPFHIDAAWASRNDPVAQDGYFSVVGRNAKVLAAPFYWPTRDPLVNPNGPPGYSTQPTPENPRDGSEADAVHIPALGQSNGPPPNGDMLRPPSYNPSVLTMMTSVPLPTSLEGYSLIARREKQKLHVLRMEYYTVYDQPDSGSSATVVQTAVQTNTQSTNAVTGQTSGQTTSQMTGTTVTTGKADANAPSSATLTSNPLQCAKGKCAPILLKLDRPIDPNLVVTVRGEQLPRVRDWRGRATSLLPPAQSGTDLSGAASSAGSLTMSQLELTRGLLESDKFAPNTWFALNSHELLINISVEVAQESEFPIIQLADPSGSVTIPHDLRQSFTELVLDNFRLKPQTEFSIQKEIGRQNWRDSDDRLCPNGAAATDGCVFGRYGRFDAAISSGPFPFSTFLPLFSPEPASRNFYATIDDTGNNLEIGFLGRSAAQLAADKTPHFDWLSAQTRVILEDRDQDFAWSLSCEVRGDVLNCRIPREEISRAYLNFLRACPDDEVCPGLETDRQSLVGSLDYEVRTLADSAYCRDLTVDDFIGRQQGGATLPACTKALPQNQPDATKLTGALAYQETLKQARTRYLGKSVDLQGFRNAFAATMQVWIEQADSEGKNVFYSREPARLGFFPISSDYWGRIPFQPWIFKEADGDTVTIQECNYLPNAAQKNILVYFSGLKLSNVVGPALGPPSRPGWIYVDSDTLYCGKLRLATAALAVDPLQINMEFPGQPPPVIPCPPPSKETIEGKVSLGSGPCPPDNPRPIRTTIAIPRFRIGPNFRQNEIHRFPDLRTYSASSSTTSGMTAQTSAAVKETNYSTSWRLAIPVDHTTCSDGIELPEGSPIKKEWRNGFTPLTACEGLKDPASVCPKDSSTGNDPRCKSFSLWKAGEDAGRLNLYLEIPKASLMQLAGRVNVVRTSSDGAKWVVGVLPDLRRLLLPSRLTLDSLSATQFVLRGEHAEEIDAVAMRISSDKPAHTFPTAPGVDFALVTLPAAPASDAKSGDTTGGAGGSTNSMQINVGTTKDNTATITVNTNNSTTPKPAAPPDNKTKSSSPSDETSKDSKSLAAGSYTVIPLIQVDSVPPDLTALKASAATAAKDVVSAQSDVDKAKKAIADAKGQPAKTPAKLGTALNDAQSKLTEKKTAATAAANAVKAAKPTPIYMPLNVTDEKGKELIFTVADTKKPAPTTPATTPPPTTTCVAPCLMMPCVASCPAPAPAAAPKAP